MSTDAPASRPQRMRRGRRGSVAIMAALMIPFILGFAMLIVDIGNIYRVRSELQNVADSAALAGAAQIDGTVGGLTAADLAVNDYAAQHFANNVVMTTTTAPHEFGHWYFAADTTISGFDCGTKPCFFTIGSPASNLGLVNAVRVRGLRTAATGSAVANFFAPIFGFNNSDVPADAVAIGGGPSSVPCGFPMAVPDCALQVPVANGSCGYCMTFANANTDTAGWTSFSGNGGCGVNQIATAVAAACGATGQLVDGNNVCGTCSQPVSTGQTPQLCNGTNLTTQGFCGTVQAILARGGAGTATAFEVRVPVLRTGRTQANCGAFNFSGNSTPISGFATMQIYGAKCGNNNALVIDNTAGQGCAPPPNGDLILGRLLCTETVAEFGGGAPSGTAARVRLVK